MLIVIADQRSLSFCTLGPRKSGNRREAEGESKICRYVLRDNRPEKKTFLVKEYDWCVLSALVVELTSCVLKLNIYKIKTNSHLLRHPSHRGVA